MEKYGYKFLKVSRYDFKGKEIDWDSRYEKDWIEGKINLPKFNGDAVTIEEYRGIERYIKEHPEYEIRFESDNVRHMYLKRK